MTRPTRPKDYASNTVPPHVARYIRARLWVETAGKRGPQSEIAAQTGVSRVFVGYLRDGQRGVTRSYAESLARFWGLDYAGLEGEAERHAAHPLYLDPPSQDVTLPFGKQPEWRAQRAEARRLYPTIPQRYIEETADVVIPGMTVTHRAIQQVALLRWEEDVKRQADDGRRGGGGSGGGV